MDISEIQVAALKQKALEGDLEALRALREGGFFKSLSAAHGFPTSRAQKRLWVSVKRERAGDTYVISLALRLDGSLRQDALRHALETLQARHETLRTRFAERDGELRQFVEETCPLPLTFKDLHAAGNPEAECREFLQEQLLTPFDLDRAPLWRAHLCRLAEAEHVLALFIHHLVADAWSMEILKRELAVAYHSYCEGRPDALPPLAHQYRDYASGRFDRLTAATTAAASRLYWQDKLSAPPPRLQLPTDFPRKGGVQSAGACERVQWEAERVNALKGYAASHGASLFVVLQALVKVLLYRYTGQTDLIVGTPFAGRNHPELEGQVGLFINLLALRDRVEPEGDFAQLLGQSIETAYGAYEHGDYPFDELVEGLSKNGDAGQSPLFDVLVALQNVPAANVSVSELRASEFQLADPHAYYDLTFEFAEQGDGLVLLLTYSTELFEAATVRRMCGHLERLTEAVLTEPGKAIRELPLLTEAERAQFDAWNRTETAYPRRQTVAELFAEQATSTPEAVAVTFDGGQLTYRELEERANRLAQFVNSFFVERGEAARERVVGLCLDRTPELIASMLGVLKAGAAYLPLDAELPAERLRFMLEDARVSLLLTSAGLKERLSSFDAEVVCVDGPEVEGFPHVPPPSEANAESLAYVIYTSGSTGKPKGVCVPHYAINRLVRETNYIRIGPGDCIAQAATAAFDAATFEIWGALLNGATVHLLGREEVLDASLFARRLRERRVNILFLTTALFNRLAQADASMFGSLDYLLFGGEACDPRWVAAVLEGGRPRHLLHVYGPTESTTYATWYEVEEVAGGASTVPIGRPLSNTRLHLLDAHRQAVPIGVRGELYIGGDGLARGYLNRPELTREHFVEVEGFGRLYRTGDLCRFRADGALEFIGRRDEQLKLRGFRIEPGEIESVLSSHPRVLESIVQARATTAGETQLVAYVATGQGGALTAGALRDYAKKRLPGYMVPAHFVCLEKLPLNANGKVDRASLPEPEDLAPDDNYVAPRTPTEEIVAGIWADVLRRERPGVRDDFFALGGHSLMAMQVLSRIRDGFGIELPLHALFEVSELGELAALIEAARRGDEPPPPLVRQEPRADSSLSFAQQRLWFLAQLPSGAGATYSINAAFRLSARPDVAALRAALLQLTERQQSLRMNFRERAGRAVVLLREPYDPLEVRAPRAESDAGRELDASELAAEHASRPFDLERDELLRVTLAEAGGGEWLLLFGLHHIIADGWSLGVLAAELSELYEAALEGREARLAPLPVQYTDYAAWQREWLRGEVLERQISYWREQL
ncbi:MAG TPA: amino acid adenylation domain-containing protein, partial [Pyrinomonadaceae bacterium]|nr:amino acid adenylation domain-containing protein [Pyrinomonadaceae bacterium]